MFINHNNYNTFLVSVNKMLDKVLELLSDEIIDYRLDHYIALPIYTLEQKYVLGKLFEFNSVVIIICGEMHMVDYYTFIKNGKTIKQIITYP
jgi:hypothetical protein